MRSGARPRAPTGEGQVEQSEAVKVSAFASRKSACVAMWCCSMTPHHAGSCLSGPTCLHAMLLGRCARAQTAGLAQGGRPRPQPGAPGADSLRGQGAGREQGTGREQGAGSWEHRAELHSNALRVQLWREQGTGSWGGVACAGCRGEGAGPAGCRRGPPRSLQYDGGIGRERKEHAQARSQPPQFPPGAPACECALCVGYCKTAARAPRCLAPC